MTVPSGTSPNRSTLCEAARFARVNESCAIVGSVIVTMSAANAAVNHMPLFIFMSVSCLRPPVTSHQFSPRPRVLSVYSRFAYAIWRRPAYLRDVRNYRTNDYLACYSLVNELHQN